MAEQLLDDAQVGAAIEQVRRERMAERVRRDARGRPARAGQPLEPGAQARARRGLRRRGSGTARVGLRPGRVVGTPASSSGRPSARYASSASRAGRPSRPIRSFRPLPITRSSPASQLQRAEVGRGELADPEARGVGGLDERPVAERERRREAFARPARPSGDVGVDGTEQPLDLVDLEDARQASWQARRGDRAPRVARRETLARA